MCLLRAFIYNCLSTVYTCAEKVSRRALRGRASLVTSHVRAARALVLLTLQCQKENRPDEVSLILVLFLLFLTYKAAA